MIFEFIIDIFMECFPESLVEKLFGPLYCVIDKRWPNASVLKMILSILSVILFIAFGVAIAFGIVVGFIFIITKLFNL